MKKKFSILLAGLLMAAMTVTPKFPVYAAGLSIALSDQDLKVGDTFTATISVPGGGSSQVALSYDNSVISFDSSSVTSSGGDGEKMISVNGAKGTVTFTVVGSGSTSLTATSTSGTDSSGAAADYSAAGVVVKAAGSQENSDTDSTNGDNSLSGLSLSDGTLSPEFSYKTTKYTASVDYDVTSIDVSATPSNPSATIDAITGTDNLQVGNNTVTVVVKAGNGSTATYTINVERKEQSEDAAEEEENQPEEQQSADGSKVFTINGQNYIPADTIPEDVIPADFSESAVSIDGTDYPALSFTKAELTLLYLIPENTEDAGKLYLYNTNDGNVYPFILLHTDSHYAIVQNPDAASVPEGFTQTSVTVGETENVTAYHRNDAVQNPDSDFYYLYCLNDQGQNYWYQYDNAEGTYQRYAEQLDSSSEQQNENEQYNEALNQLKKMKQKNRYMIFGMIFGAAILIIIIINLLIARKDQDGLDDAYDDPDEDDDMDDLDDDPDDDEEDEDSEDELDSEEDVRDPEDDSEEDGGNNASEENVTGDTEESGADEPEKQEEEEEDEERETEETNDDDDDIEFLDLK